MAADGAASLHPLLDLSVFGVGDNGLIAPRYAEAEPAVRTDVRAVPQDVAHRHHAPTLAAARAKPGSTGATNAVSTTFRMGTVLTLGSYRGFCGPLPGMVNVVPSALTTRTDARPFA